MQRDGNFCKHQGTSPSSSSSSSSTSSSPSPSSLPSASGCCYEESRQGDTLRYKASQSGASASLEMTEEPRHEKKGDGTAGDQKGKKRVRAVKFAPGPGEIASKYMTKDGHPDHEGETAKQRRRVRRPGTAEDLTPASVMMLEKVLGDSCKPSITRLKRRAGMLPLRNKQCIKISLQTTIEDGMKSDEDAIEGGSMASTEEGETRREMRICSRGTGWQRNAFEVRRGKMESTLSLKLESSSSMRRFEPKADTSAGPGGTKDDASCRRTLGQCGAGGKRSMRLGSLDESFVGSRAPPSLVRIRALLGQNVRKKAGTDR